MIISKCINKITNNYLITPNFISTFIHFYVKIPHLGYAMSVNKYFMYRTIQARQYNQWRCENPILADVLNRNVFVNALQKMVSKTCLAIDKPLKPYLITSFLPFFGGLKEGFILGGAILIA
jgi:hypothetical protein